jgi:hypothetical protein
MRGCEGLNVQAHLARLLLVHLLVVYLLAGLQQGQHEVE